MTENMYLELMSINKLIDVSSLINHYPFQKIAKLFMYSRVKVSVVYSKGMVNDFDTLVFTYSRHRWV